MNEFLLKAIVRLFAIVAKERVSELEKETIRNFILREVNEGEAEEYLGIFDEFSVQKRALVEDGMPEKPRADGEMDLETEEFVEDWANIIMICKHINTEPAPRAHQQGGHLPLAAPGQHDLLYMPDHQYQQQDG